MTTAKERMYRLKDSLRCSVFEDGGVVFDLESRACNEINRSAARIIGYLSRANALVGVIEAVRLEFDSPPSTIEKDLIDFIENLVRKGWLDVQ